MTVSTGPPANGATYGTAYGSTSAGEDPFSFLSSGLGNLSMNEESRRMLRATRRACRDPSMTSEGGHASRLSSAEHAPCARDVDVLCT